MGDPSPPQTNDDAPGDPSFPCPRCGTRLPIGATRCAACAGAAPADLEAPGTSAGPLARKVLAVGCLSIAFLLLLCMVAAQFLGQKLRETQAKAQKRQQQAIIDEERRRYEADQAQRARPGPRMAEPSGELAVLGRPLQDLAGRPVCPGATLERGGVLLVYPMGCPDCTPKLAAAEACAKVSQKHGLGVQVIVLGGTAEGVEKDKLPEALRAAALLDPDGKVGEALNARHLAAIVVDSDGSSVVYRGSPEEAAGMIPSVAQGE